MTDSLQALLLISAPALAIYGLLPGRFRPAWLLIASYAFCAWWHWQGALVLLGVTAGNYALAHLLERQAGRSQRAALAAGIALNVGVLAITKYALLQRGLALIGKEGAPPDALAILMPLGLSFTTLHTIGYLIDVANGRIPAVRSPLHFALYLAYFPKLIAGPIERAKTFVPQLMTPRAIDAERMARSAALIGMGLVRKVLIGNTLLRMIPPDVFRQPYDFGGNALTVYLLAYGFVIYNDFAGYTAIARGISGFFGIDLSPNFQLPYFASTFTEFWNRWHMSFSFWLRDYIFFPVSRGLARVIPDRRHPIHRIVPPMITMLISGLWHAADWHMLIWGGLHGLYVMARQVPLPGRRPGPPDKQPLGVRIASTLIVFGCVMLAWIPFRMGVITSWLYLTGIIVRFGQGPIPIVPLLLLIPALALDVLEARGGELAALRWPRPARSAALALMILIALVTMFNAATGTTFVYQEF